MKYIIDAWAWIEYLIGSEYGSKVKLIIENKENEIFTCSLTISEVISVTKRENRDFEEAYRVILSNSKNIDVTPRLSKEAGLMHAEYRKKIKDFGLADAFLICLAKSINGKVLTGDRHFKEFNNVVLLR